MSYPPPITSFSGSYQPPRRPDAPMPSTVPPNSFQDQLMRLEARIASAEAKNAELEQRLFSQEAEYQGRLARLEALVDQANSVVRLFPFFPVHLLDYLICELFLTALNLVREYVDSELASPQLQPGSSPPSSLPVPSAPLLPPFVPYVFSRPFFRKRKSHRVP